MFTPVEFFLVIVGGTILLGGLVVGVFYALRRRQ